MISTAAALHSFLSGFGIPAYVVNTVPDEAELPYLTYPLTEPEWNSPATFYVQVYTRNKTQNAPALRKADEIVQAIGPAGVRIPCDGGYVVLNLQNPTVQLIVDGDIRSAYINLQINAYHMPGL